MAKKDYSAGSQRYMTPETIYQPLLDFEGVEKFDMDVACENKNIPAKKYYTESGLYAEDFFFQESPENGLTGAWEGLCFMNCPWDKCKQFLPKALAEAEKGVRIWAVLPADRWETNYFQESILRNPNCFAFFMSQKQGFLVPESPIEKPKPSVKVVLVYFGKDAKDKWAEFDWSIPLRGTTVYNALNLTQKQVNDLNCIKE